MEDTMSHISALRQIVGFFEHAAFALLGLALMVVGLALGVTIVMLPAGLMIGLIGLAVVVTSLFARIYQQP
jgi:hypothetical protein